MAQVNPLTRELLVKLVYYGPGLGGKTTSLQAIHSASPPETRGQLVSLATPVDRTLYFDFLPLRARQIRDHHVRLQLFTVPGQVYLSATRKLVLTGVDGLVFVADSQRDRHDANLESLEDLMANLEEQGRALHSVPVVFQYNKRDLPEVMRVEQLDRSLNQGERASFPTIATTGEGVMEALDRLVDDTLEHLEESGMLGTSSAPPEQPSFERAERALEEQIGEASEEIWRASVQGALEARATAEVDEPFRPPSRPAPRKPSTRPGPQAMAGGPSWAPVFREHADEVRLLEVELAGGHYADAIVRCDELTGEILGSVARRAGGRDPLLALGLLKVPADRWLTFKRVVQRARSGGPLDVRDALHAFLTLVDVRERSEPFG